jgi:hypothetical protein
MPRHEVCKVRIHGPHICCHKNTTCISGNPEHGIIWRSVWNHASCGPEVDCRFSTPHPPANIGIKVRVGLKNDPQSGYRTLDA